MTEEAKQLIADLRTVSYGLADWAIGMINGEEMTAAEVRLMLRGAVNAVEAARAGKEG